jgi:2-polyprenyl-3-methyl-5-hydroxy-6-metoxy-1,4-benzoquinol methylase
MLPVKKLETVIALVKPATVLDVGCGTGQSTSYFLQKNIQVLGVEGSSVAIQNSSRPDLMIKHDLRKPLELNRSFDLVWCFEVAEHIHPDFVDIFISSLVRHSHVIALSAAPPGQGGEGHFNEQPKSYWIEKFSHYGYQLHDAWTAAIQETEEFYSENMMVFYSEGVRAT